jgi:glycosyltransferase involved in cell wall biosynthesis
MYKQKAIAVVVPAYKEEKLIGRVIETMPSLVDRIIVVDDCSPDQTSQKVQEWIQKLGDRVVLIRHSVNQGVGGAIATGYKWARDHDIDIAVVMAGDAQMDPRDLPALLDPVAEGRVDYSKGNRLFTGEAFKKIPKVRYFGNAALSLLTKVASGYWHIADSQTGYTAIGRKALHTIDWDQMYKRYGQPNDLLVTLNIFNFKVLDVPVEPVYGVGEQSGIKIRKILFSLSWLLVKLFFKRMREKYIIRDFHPLVFFYMSGIGLGLVSLALLGRFTFYFFAYDATPRVNFLAFMLASIMSVQFILFAMLFDMEANKELK